MTPDEIFTKIRNTEYDETGLKVNYKIETDTVNHNVILLFQETRGNLDWTINFDFPRKLYKNQKRHLLVHRGYVKAWKSANDVIVGQIKQQLDEHPGYNVQIFGWSYGGGISLVAAEDINYQLKVKPQVITFGAPKICATEETAQTIRDCCSQLLEYGQYNDIVTSVVPWYKSPNRIRLGSKYNFFKFVNPWKYHTSYSDKELYKDLTDSSLPHQAA